MKKEYIHCEFKGKQGLCNKPCGQILPSRKILFYSWCWLRGTKVMTDNGNDVTYKYYCCVAHYENREKKKNKKYDKEGSEDE